MAPQPSPQSPSAACPSPAPCASKPARSPPPPTPGTYARAASPRRPRGRTTWSPSRSGCARSPRPTAAGSPASCWSATIRRTPSPSPTPASAGAGVEEVRSPVHHGGNLRGQRLQLQLLGHLPEPGNGDRRHQHSGLRPRRSVLPTRAHHLALRRTRRRRSVARRRRVAHRALPQGRPRRHRPR